MEKVLQIEAMDEELRNGLWTAIAAAVWDHAFERTQYRTPTERARAVQSLAEHIWIFFFKKPQDTFPTFDEARTQFRTFHFKAAWNGVYDMIEFMLSHVEDDMVVADLQRFCNTFLQQENAGYRIIASQITPITSANELSELQTALETGVKTATIHLESAVKLMSDRKNPDYRNSIKEAISAVEATCGMISGKPKATLGDALKVLREKGSVHPALEKAFSAIYGYTSDANGIRHALTEESNLTFSDAKFMVISCSAFVNYLRGKAAELNIRLAQE